MSSHTLMQFHKEFVRAILRKNSPPICQSALDVADQQLAKASGPAMQNAEQRLDRATSEANELGTKLDAAVANRNATRNNLDRLSAELPSRAQSLGSNNVFNGVSRSAVEGLLNETSGRLRSLQTSLNQQQAQIVTLETQLAEAKAEAKRAQTEALIWEKAHAALAKGSGNGGASALIPLWAAIVTTIGGIIGTIITARITMAAKNKELARKDEELRLLHEKHEREAPASLTPATDF
jgi:hypothetical protein